MSGQVAHDGGQPLLLRHMPEDLQGDQARPAKRQEAMSERRFVTTAVEIEGREALTVVEPPALTPQA